MYYGERTLRRAEDTANGENTTAAWKAGLGNFNSSPPALEVHRFAC